MLAKGVETVKKPTVGNTTNKQPQWLKKFTCTQHVIIINLLVIVVTVSDVMWSISIFNSANNVSTHMLASEPILTDIFPIACIAI